MITFLTSVSFFVGGKWINSKKIQEFYLIIEIPRYNTIVKNGYFRGKQDFLTTKYLY